MNRKTVVVVVSMVVVVIAVAVSAVDVLVTYVAPSSLSTIS